MGLTKGTLYLCSIRDLEMYDVLDDKFFISRFVKDHSTLRKYGFVQVAELAPSKGLVQGYLKLKQEGNWNKDTFETWYKPLFLLEVKEVKELRTALNQVYKLLKSGKDVVLACYCHDSRLCHRKIIGEEFSKLGFAVNLR